MNRNEDIYGIIFPNLFIVGTPKAGTTSLHDALMQHPDICGSEKYKDYMFFSSEMKLKDINLITSSYKKQKYLLDTGANYSFSENSLARIKNYCNSPKIILIIRNPVDRMLSDFYWRTKYGRCLVSETDILNSQNPKELFGEMYQLSLISDHLKRLFKMFSNSQIKIVLFEELIEDPNKALSDILMFLELNYFPIEIKHKNPTGKSIFPIVTRFLRGKSKLKKTISDIVPRKIKIAGAYIVKLNTINLKTERKLDRKKLEYLKWFENDLRLAEALGNLSIVKYYLNK